MTGNMSHIFGPVPSRRLGRSLGVDVIPAKTCSFDCVYCESGATTRLSVQREEFVQPSAVLEELDQFFRLFPNAADVITFSSAGEPTLYLGLGELISAIKKRYREYPLVVLTNGSLLWDPEVRKDLMTADRVVPSLDAATLSVFKQLNKPHPSLHLPTILEGLRAFHLEYSGQFHLEVSLIAGLNDHPGELAAIAHEVDQIKPDKVELNTVVRPPARPGTMGLSKEAMVMTATHFPEGLTEIIGEFHAPVQRSQTEDLPTRILETVGRRPCTVSELAVSLGMEEETLEAEAKQLEHAGKLRISCFQGKPFLCRAFR